MVGKHTSGQISSNWLDMLASVSCTCMCYRNSEHNQSILHLQSTEVAGVLPQSFGLVGNGGEGGIGVSVGGGIETGTRIGSIIFDTAEFRKNWKRIEINWILNLVTLFVVARILPPSLGWVKKKASPTTATIVIFSAIFPWLSDQTSESNVFSGSLLPLYIPHGEFDAPSGVNKRNWKKLTKNNQIK